MQGVAVVVIRTAGKNTYCYTAARQWMKLAPSSHFGRCVIEVRTSGGTWSLALKGLRKGTLSVTAVAADWADQVSRTVRVTRKLTR